MSDKEDVQKFLDEFKLKANVFGIFFPRPEKNYYGLLDLEINANIRKEIILNLEVENYYRGPNKDRDLPQFDVWEFGYNLNERDEIYIKLSTRKEKSKCVCLSFHRAESQIKYTYETK